MTAYNIEFSYMVEEFGTTVVNADNVEQAEEFAKEYVLDTYAEVAASTVVIDSIKEVN